MGRAFSRTVGVLAAGVVLTGAVAAAWAASEARVTVVTKASPPPLSGGSPRLLATPGFGLVSTSEKPPKFADYTILTLMRLATPWPIEGTAPQAEKPLCLLYQGRLSPRENQGPNRSFRSRQRNQLGWKRIGGVG